MVVVTSVSGHRHKHAHDTINNASAGAGCVTVTNWAYAVVIYHVRFFPLNKQLLNLTVRFNN